jgi:(2Fe-2S) ferredoxin
MNDAPKMAAYGRHILFCTGQYCDPEGKAALLYRRLPALLGELGSYDNPCRVKRGTTPCLGVCSGGPLLVVYPDGVWYHHVDEALLKCIIEQHLTDDQPVDEAVFHRLDAHTE